MKRYIILFAILLIVISACSKDEGGGTAPPPVPIATYYVDASAGDDANAGSQGAPFKTITHAIAAAARNDIIIASPATYDTSSGETFPLMLKEGQFLIGDEVNKGKGAVPTMIVGDGAFTFGPFTSATIVGATGARIAGFVIGSESNANFHFGIVNIDASTQIFDNTLDDLMYGGVYLELTGNPIVARNDFNTVNYGVFVLNGIGNPIIRENEFITTDRAVDVTGGVASVLIRDNIVTGSGMFGIVISLGNPTINDNTFNRASGYTDGALSIFQGAPTIRGNTFVCDVPGLAAIVIESEAVPDFGKIGSLGQNDFTGVNGGYVMWYKGDDIISALGNTWPQDPPVEGDDYFIDGTGTILVF